jgi:Kef-type K+ transport system membrane component KefB
VRVAELGETEVLLLRLALLILVAKVFGEIARRVHQPPVAGEILGGVLIGPSVLGWIPPFETHVLPITLHDLASANSQAFLEALGELGVLILLFEVGLESNLRDMRRVGTSATLVGVLGVAISLAAGYAASWFLMQAMPWDVTEAAMGRPWLLHLFVGATLTATSVGITARVLRELGVLGTPEAQTILGAAVIDDVLGLIVLAIVTALAAGAAITAASVGTILAFAVGFFVAAVLVGTWLGPRLFGLIDRVFRGEYALLAFAIVFMLAVSSLANLAGLAAIVGAFAAGLALSGSDKRHDMASALRPVASLFVSLFFVLLGARVDLRDLGGDTATYAMAAALLLTATGILAKLAAGWGVTDRIVDKFAVGVGMVPRGEVGLIFAVYGLTHALVAGWQYATLVLVVLLTTLATPPWLKAIKPRFKPMQDVSRSSEGLSHAMDR